MFGLHQRTISLSDNPDGEKQAFGDEIHLFLHCHLRGYDKEGKGVQMHAGYYDKYGAPVKVEDLWTEGYYTIEQTLASHFNHCLNPHVGFPLVIGYGGTAHLYNVFHGDEEPWNWTGWIPKQKTWVGQLQKNMNHFNNRYFLALRGNEVQNNLWDYHPLEDEEEDNNNPFDWIYEQISPNDEYRGGYFYKDHEDRAFARYLHVIALKNHYCVPTDEKKTTDINIEEESKEVACNKQIPTAMMWKAKKLKRPMKEITQRYNFIVHPLAYRSSLNYLPDASVDGIQWAIMNIHFEKNFTEEPKNWGNKIHGMEIFNDFTYYHSWLPKEIYNTHNGSPWFDPVTKTYRIIWFDTYPLEYCEFLLDSALRRNVYLHILSANDAYYERHVLPPSEVDDEQDKLDDDKFLERFANLLADPKGGIIKHLPVDETCNRIPHRQLHVNRQRIAKRDVQQREAMDFLKDRPYGLDSVFGYTTLLDSKKRIRRAVFPTDKPWVESIENGERCMMSYLINGQFFSHTGIYDLFNFSKCKQTIPYIIFGQKDVKVRDKIEEDMNVKFFFAPVKKGKERLIWQYSLETDTESVHGYFKLHHATITTLDLSDVYKVSCLKWIRFTVFDPENTMKRAWFNPIKGGLFTEPIMTDYQLEYDRVTDLKKHRIAKTKVDEIRRAATGIIVYHESAEPFIPNQVSNTSNLVFDFDKQYSVYDEELLHAYFCQGYSNQADFHKIGTELDEETERLTGKSYKAPPRIKQNICGYFSLSSLLQTRLDLSASWDSESIDIVSFYTVDPVTLELNPVQLLKSVSKEAGHKMSDF